MRIAVAPGTVKLEILRLNPCFWGRYADRTQKQPTHLMKCSLNPCFWGRYADSDYLYSEIETEMFVLILVFGEDMRIVKTTNEQRVIKLVLILVFGEDMRIAYCQLQ